MACIINVLFFMQFIETDIDGEAFLLLSNDDIRTMVKTIGAQLKLIRKRDHIKETTGTSISMAQTASDSKKPSNVSLSLNHSSVSTLTACMHIVHAGQVCK